MSLKVGVVFCIDFFVCFGGFCFVVFGSFWFGFLLWVCGVMLGGIFYLDCYYNICGGVFGWIGGLVLSDCSLNGCYFWEMLFKFGWKFEFCCCFYCCLWNWFFVGFGELIIVNVWLILGWSYLICIVWIGCGEF